MSYLLYPNCHPGYGCFTCPHKDCIRPVSASGNTTKEETRLRRAGLQETVGKPSKVAITHYIYHR